MENQQLLKPALLPIGELFRKSFEVYIKKMWSLAMIVLLGVLGYLPVLLSGLIAFLIINNNQGNLTLFSILLFLIGLLLSLLIWTWIQVVVFCAIKEDNLKLKQLLIMALPKIQSFFWVTLLNTLVVMVGFILFIIPGFIFLVWFLFAPYIFISESLNGKLALKRSRELVQGYWWAIFGRFLSVTIIGIILSWSPVVGSIISIFFLTPFSLIFFYVLYEDLKRMKSQ